MPKPRNYTFDATPEQVYQAISNMLILNAQQFDKSYANCTDISTIKYTYGEKNKVTVKVTVATPHELIKYHTAMEKRERYDVSYALSPTEDGKTLMSYTIDIVTDIKKIEVNYSFMSIFYSFKQKKAFKKMCAYLQSSITQA